MSRQQRIAILKKAHMRGCVLEPDALKAFEGYLKESKADVDTLLPAVLGILSETAHGGQRITGAVMNDAIARYDQNHSASATAESVQVVPLFQVPKVRYSERTKGFVEVAREPEGLVSTAPPADRVRALHDRFMTIKQRLQRTVNFKRAHHSIYKDQTAAGWEATLAGDNGEEDRPPLYRLASLEGMPPHLVMTVLARLSKNHGTDEHWLEDDTTRVKVNFEFDIGESYTTGIFFDGVVIVAIGRWQGDIFHCQGMGLPPAETRVNSLAALPTFVDFFGLCPPHNQLPALREREKNSFHTMFVLAGVSPARPGTLQRLGTLLEKVAGQPDTYPPWGLTIVIAGNFMEKPFEYGDTMTCAAEAADSAGESHVAFQRHIQQIADRIALAAPTLAEQASFIFVPGPNDPAVGGCMYPRLPFPALWFEKVAARLKTVELASNPCRLRYLTKEIVLFREDVSAKLLAHALVPPLKEPGHVTLVKTLADQAHLLPLPPRFASICTPLESMLRLYPLPDLVIVADRDKSWTQVYKDCPFVNPGSFSRCGTFLIYEPSSGGYDLQMVPV